MFLLNKVLDLKGPKGADNFLASDFNRGYLKAQSPRKVRDFLERYLSYPFDVTKENPFVILNYMEVLIISDSLLADSEYFKTMPSSYVSKLFEVNPDFLIKHQVPYFASLLLKKVDKKEDIKYFIDLSFRVQGLAEKLISFQDMDLIIENLDYLRKFNYIFLIVILISNKFSVSDLKRYALANTQITVIDLIYIFSNSYDHERLNVLYDVLISKNETKEYDGGENLFQEFVNYFYNLKGQEEEIFEYMANKILNSNNLAFMYAWVTNTTCRLNYSMIAKIIEEMNDIQELCTLVLSLSKDYAVYAINKIKNTKDKEVYEGILNAICILPLENIELIDELINLYPELITVLKRENSVRLLEAGTTHARFMFNELDLTEKERLNLLKSLMADNMESVALYGPYLLTGDKRKLMNDKETLISSNILDSIRPR